MYIHLFFDDLFWLATSELYIYSIYTMLYNYSVYTNYNISFS